MNEINLIVNPEVELVFAKYPDSIAQKLLTLRALIIDTARETEGVDSPEETLKWGGTELCQQDRQYHSHRLETKKSRPLCDVFQVYEQINRDFQIGLWR